MKRAKECVTRSRVRSGLAFTTMLVLVGALAFGCAPLLGFKPTHVELKGKADGAAVVRGEIETGEVIGNWLGHLKRKDFDQAVRESTEQSGLFTHVEGSGDAEYTLVVQVVDILIEGGIVKLTAAWKLKKAGERKLLFDKWITSSFEASILDAFTGTRRATLMIQGATRENISKGLAEVSMLFH